MSRSKSRISEVQANDGGDFFPIFGICLGLEMLGLITNSGQEYLTRYVVCRVQCAVCSVKCAVCNMQCVVHYVLDQLWHCTVLG